jgi:hypothetical protein
MAFFLQFSTASEIIALGMLTAVSGIAMAHIPIARKDAETGKKSHRRTVPELLGRVLKWVAVTLTCHSMAFEAYVAEYRRARSTSRCQTLFEEKRLARSGSVSDGVDRDLPSRA